MAKYSEAQKRAVAKYHKEHLEQIAFRAPIGKRDEYKAKAAAHGKSLARYIMDLIENDTTPTTSIKFNTDLFD